MKTNITLKLDVGLLRELREFAAEGGTSVRAMLATQLKQIVREHKSYHRARGRALARLRKGMDLRWARSAESLSVRHSQFRAAILDIAAPLHGRPKDELDGEDVRGHRRTKRFGVVSCDCHSDRCLCRRMGGSRSEAAPTGS